MMLMMTVHALASHPQQQQQQQRRMTQHCLQAQYHLQLQLQWSQLLLLQQQQQSRQDLNTRLPQVVCLKQMKTIRQRSSMMALLLLLLLPVGRWPVQLLLQQRV
jgi:hypothetical protein